MDANKRDEPQKICIAAKERRERQEKDKLGFVQTRIAVTRLFSLGSIRDPFLRFLRLSPIPSFSRRSLRSFAAIFVFAIPSASMLGFFIRVNSCPFVVCLPWRSLAVPFIRG
jgi:hypothetical protein